jgi:hypothetical protein
VMTRALLDVATEAAQPEVEAVPLELAEAPIEVEVVRAEAELESLVFEAGPSEVQGERTVVATLSDGAASSGKAPFGPVLAESRHGAIQRSGIASAGTVLVGREAGFAASHALRNHWRL